MLHIKGGKSLTWDNLQLAIPGFKHALVSTLCSTVLFPETVFHFSNVPLIEDTRVLIKIFHYLGASCHLQDNHLTIQTDNLCDKPIPADLSKLVHGALYLFPVMLARFGKAEIGQTGGCAIGEMNQIGKRPIEHMLKILAMAGFDTELHEDKLCGKLQRRITHALTIDIQQFSTVSTELTGPHISGATKTALLIANYLAQPLTIVNPYTKPDVTELLRLYSLLKLNIERQQNKIIIAKSNQPPKEIHFDLLADLSVLMTYITIAVIFKQPLSIYNERLSELQTALKTEFAILTAMGVELVLTENQLAVIPPEFLKATHIEVLSTSIYSDHQPFFALMMLHANKPATISEQVWTSRFAYASELAKLGYQLNVVENTLTLYPSKVNLNQANLHGSDLRAAAVLLLAACQAKGDFYLTGHEHLHRGYENLVSQLIAMGAEISYI